MRRTARALAVILVAAAVFWTWIAVRLLRPADNVCDTCSQGWFRWTQFAVALGGVVSMGVSAAYLVRIARTGRTWRRRRAVSAALAIFALTWSFLVIVVARL